MTHHGAKELVLFAIVRIHDGESTMVATADCENCAHHAAIEAVRETVPGDVVAIFEHSGQYSCNNESIRDANNINAVHNDLNITLANILSSIGIGVNRGNAN